MICFPRSSLVQNPKQTRGFSFLFHISGFDCSVSMDVRESCPPGESSPALFSLSPDTPSLYSVRESEEDLVMSEVHLGCPANFSGPHISRFTFSLPLVKDKTTSTNHVVSLDEDGDLVITRRSSLYCSNYVITIQHNITSSIPSVGLQVWRAELVLADFLLHKMVTSSELNGVVAIELGAGTGLVGILLARVAKTVFVTDQGNDVLDNCADNVRLNSEIFHTRARVHVRELDWNDVWLTEIEESAKSLTRYAWTSGEVEELRSASLIVAADVIYSDDLTDAFFKTLARLMMQGTEKVAYLALEKRFNFTLDDLNVVANGYSHFRSYLRDDGECNDLKNGSLPCFVGERIDLEKIPMYVKEYERGGDVEIWKIEFGKQKPSSTGSRFA